MSKRQLEDLATSNKLRSLVNDVPADVSPSDHIREMIEFLQGILKGAEKKKRQAMVSPIHVAFVGIGI